MPGDLYYGDNLDVLRHKVATESVDLVYLDPPFNSDRNYNLIHKGSQAQQHAFVDTWHWEDAAERAFAELTGHAPHGVRVPEALAGMMLALKSFLWEQQRDTLAYLSMMAIRLVEMRRVLRPTGSLYLHCDPTASHYLRIILDSVFGAKNFRNELVWLRSKNPKGSQHRLTRYSPFTDSIFYYVKSDAASVYLDRIRIVLDAEAMADKYPYSDELGPWTEYGEPSDVDGAAHLAETNPYDFQWWAVRKLGAQPPKGEKKKGGDGGIDGEVTLRDLESNVRRRGVISVKGGHTLTPEMVKGLESTVRLEKADFGVLLTMHPPTAGMRAIAREFGTIAGTSVRGGKIEHRIRIITVPEILAGTYQLPPGKNETPHSQSSPPPAEPRRGETLHLPFPAASSAKRKQGPLRPAAKAQELRVADSKVRASERARRMDAPAPSKNRAARTGRKRAKS